MAVFRFLSSALFLLLVLPLLFSGHGSVGRHAAEGAEMMMNSHHHVLEMRSLVAASTCGPLLTEQVGSIPLVHRQGPCSPLDEERLQPRNSTLIFLQDQTRVNSMRALTSSSSSSNIYHPMGNGDDLRLPVQAPSPGAGSYVVTVGLGTPRRDLPLIFDTGSALTWTRCLPCSSQGCCPQQDRCFEPSKSSSYADPPCNSASKCTYAVTYKDKSFSNGSYGRDILTLGPGYVYPFFIFGCAQNVGDGFGTSAGILGLAQGDDSFIAQTSPDFSFVFCYCIPSTSSSQGYLLLGDGALKTCRTQQFTTILSGPDPSLYFVKLLAITIGNQTLDFSKLQAPSSIPSRTILDSGTTITRLPPSVYAALQGEFKKQMSAYPVAPPLPPLLDTCYDLEGRESVVLPRMVLNFEGTDVSVDPSGVVWRQKDSQVCLGFAANEKEDELIIIGSTQQRKLNIMYDIQQKKVEFGTGNCGN